MKFSIITPTYNSEKFLGEAIASVISQKGMFEIEYIIVDGKSTDKTLQIINHYRDLINNNQYTIQCKSIIIKVICESDNGMYDAINKGFSIATGDIYAWINSDDVYLPMAFNSIVQVFNKYKKIKWVKGITSYIDEDSKITRLGQCFLYYSGWIRKGVYGRKLYFIQQSSVFWRSDIWKESKGLDTRLKLAGDYELWIKFSKFSPLYSLNAHICFFRFRKGQLSENLESYHAECENVVLSESKIEGKIDNYLKYIKKLPDFFKPFLYIWIFGFQRFFLVDLVANKVKTEYKLKRFSTYELQGSRY